MLLDLRSKFTSKSEDYSSELHGAVVSHIQPPAADTKSAYSKHAGSGRWLPSDSMSGASSNLAILPERLGRVQVGGYDNAENIPQIATKLENVLPSEDVMLTKARRLFGLKS